MNLDIYRNYVVIIDEENLTAAASRLNIAQPALTNQIRLLEEKFGAELIQTKRGVRRIKVTDAGKLLYEKAKYLCELEDAAAKEINDINRGLSGVLSIGIAPSISEQVINRLLIDFRRKYSNVTLELYELVTGKIGELLITGICEIVVIRAPLKSPHLFNYYLMEEEVMSAIFLKDNPWIKEPSDSLSVRDLVGVPICVNRTYREALKNSFYEINEKADIISTAVLRQSCVELAKSGEAVAIVPAGVMDTVEDDMLCIPVRGDAHKLQKSIVTLKNRNLSAVAANFLRFCKENLEQDWDIT
ncbi:MAG: LysR family transcriptional regulator [Deferribacterales bacterium]